MSQSVDIERPIEQHEAADEVVGRNLALGILLIVGGVLGIIASFALTMDKIAVLEDPHAGLSCYVNQTFQCGTNLASWQGSLFGFPNPLIGLVCFPVPIVVGVALLGGVRFPRWFWALFTVGMLFAVAFIAWLATESIWVLHTLCPWCALVYVVVIPMSLAVTLFALREGSLPAPAGLRRFAGAAYFWVPLISLGIYLIVAIIAQLKLNLLGIV